MTEAAEGLSTPIDGGWMSKCPDRLIPINHHRSVLRYSSRNRCSRQMGLLASGVGCMRTALVAVLVFALVGMSAASAHAMPCPNAAHLVEHALGSDGAGSTVGVHSQTDAIDKLVPTHADRCCTSVCSLCNAPAVTGSDERPRPMLVKHRLDRGDPIAGIVVRQPHKPPRR